MIVEQSNSFNRTFLLQCYEPPVNYFELNFTKHISGTAKLFYICKFQWMSTTNESCNKQNQNRSWGWLVSRQRLGFVSSLLCQEAVGAKMVFRGGWTLIWISQMFDGCVMDTQVGTEIVQFGKVLFPGLRIPRDNNKQGTWTFPENTQTDQICIWNLNPPTFPLGNSELDLVKLQLARKSVKNYNLEAFF